VNVPAANRQEIGEDDPIRLCDAVGLFFPHGGMTLSALRTEARKGRLVVERIAGKDFVTRRAINEMRRLCRDQESRHASSSEQTVESASGSSGTAEAMSAQDALRVRLAGPPTRSKPISHKGTSPTRRNVVPLRSSSEPS
jgi:hypothetical protein